MQFTTGRFVELSDYGAQDFDSIVDGPVTLLQNELDVGIVTLSTNRFVDSADWGANDFEPLPAGTITDVSSSGTNSTGGDLLLTSPSRFV